MLLPRQIAESEPTQRESKTLSNSGADSANGQSRIERADATDGSSSPNDAGASKQPRFGPLHFELRAKNKNRPHPADRDAPGQAPSSKSKKTRPSSKKTRTTADVFNGFVRGHVVLTTIIAIAVIALLVVDVQHASDILLIDPFTVTPELQKQGVTPELFSGLIDDHIKDIKDESLTHVIDLQVDSIGNATAPELEIEVRDIKFNPFSVGDSVESYCAPHVRGTVTATGGEIDVTLTGKGCPWPIKSHPNDSYASAFKTPNHSGNTFTAVDRLARKVAERVVEQRSPYIAAAYFYEEHRDAEALRAIRESWSSQDASKARIKGWISVLWGLILSDLKLYADANGKFQEAESYLVTDHLHGASGSRASDDDDISLLYTDWSDIWYDQGDYLRALSYARKAVDAARTSGTSAPVGRPTDDPSLPDAYKMLAACDVAQADNTPGTDAGKSLYADAIEIAHKSLDVDADQADVYSILAHALWAQGKENDATQYVAVAIRLNRINSENYRFLGEVDLANQSYGQAKYWLRQALRLDPNNPRLHYDYNYLHSQLKSGGH